MLTIIFRCKDTPALIACIIYVNDEKVAVLGCPNPRLTVLSATPG